MNKAALGLLVTTLTLLTVGVVMLSSTSATYAVDRYNDAYFLLKRQLIWVGIGSSACSVMAFIPYGEIRRYSVPLLLLGIILITAVFIPGIGVKVGGSRRWLDMGLWRFQPSEFVKIALVAWLAHWLAREKRRIQRTQKKLILPLIVVAIVLGLVLVEPDFGTTALLGSVAITLVFLAGAKVRWLALAGGLGALLLALLIFQNPERLDRIMVFRDLEKYKQGAGYQPWQGILAIGSGGISGAGLGNSLQKMLFLPEAHTDFIFPIIGEELGLVGTMGILLCFGLLIACSITISLKAPDPFGQYLGWGISLLIAMQALINIGVVTACLPTKGLPLPFISYGGSNLLMNMIGIGVLLSIFRFGYGGSLKTEQEILSNNQVVT